MTATIDQAIDRIRAFALSRHWRKSRLAAEAGLSDTTLRDFDNPVWNPTAATIRKLERIIPASFPDRHAPRRDRSSSTAPAGDQPIGLFKNAAAVESFLVARLVYALHPESIWIFGSRGRGTHRPDSDFDVLIVLPGSASDVAHDDVWAYEPIAGSGLP